MKVTTIDQVIEYFRAHKREFAINFGIQTIGLFGSLVRDTFDEQSDIDIAIEMIPEKKTLSNFLQFKRHLEKEFSRTVDLGIESALKPIIRDTIKKEIIYV